MLLGTVRLAIESIASYEYWGKRIGWWSGICILYWSDYEKWRLKKTLTPSPQVQQALTNVMQDCTVLVVAHRLSTVEKADNIVVIDRGAVAEQGTHDQLMASRGLYYKLVQRQILGIETGAEILNVPKDEEMMRAGRTGGAGGPRQRNGSSGSESEFNMLRYWRN